ncbi:hypothetical protein [Candidatus Amarobacter glycogenicus]|uniref:hypothetical protein n=1 Tax=Candidatus Amarobacter glycogenicus TaxID=3140699 RepID=UPI0031CC8A45
MPAEYLSEEAEQFWRYIKSSLSDLLDLVAGQDDEVIRWRPPARDANSIIILARHASRTPASTSSTPWAGSSTTTTGRRTSGSTSPAMRCSPPGHRFANGSKP